MGEGLEVRLSPAEPVGPDRGLRVHYTLDGRPPTAADPIYDGPIALDGPTTVQAVAIADGRAPGPVASATFSALSPELAGYTSTAPVVVIDRAGRGMPTREAYGEGLLVAWTPGEDGLTRLSDPPAWVSRVAIRVRGQSSAGAPKPMLFHTMDSRPVPTSLGFDWTRLMNLLAHC